MFSFSRSTTILSSLSRTNKCYLFLIIYIYAGFNCNST
nr:MAG TPA: hypothetical protein [Caudoviricetes sp.]